MSKPRQFLSTAEMELISALFVAKTHMDDLKVRFGKHMGMDERIALSAAEAQLGKYLSGVFSRVGSGFGTDFKKYCHSHKLVWMPNEQPHAENSLYKFTTQELDDALEHIVTKSCVGCPGVEDCRLMSFFLRAGVAECDPDDPICTYRNIDPSEPEPPGDEISGLEASKLIIEGLGRLDYEKNLKKCRRAVGARKEGEGHGARYYYNKPAVLLWIAKQKEKSNG